MLISKAGNLFLSLVLSIIFMMPFASCFAQKSPPQENIFMKSDKVEYKSKEDVIVATGNNYIEFQGYELRSDYIYYDIGKDELYAEGNLHITDRDDRVILGQRALFTDALKSGVIKEFMMRSNDTHLISRLAHRRDENNIYLSRSVFTPCDISCGKTPIWQINADDTHVDFENHRIVYKNLFFKVYNIPALYLPYFRHPTPKAPAQTGLLTPSLKNSSLLIPFYFRLKDNIDMTISPRLHNDFTLFELEARHKLKYGSYIVKGSFGQAPYEATEDGLALKKKKDLRYHIFSNGVFNYQDYKLGFDINSTSDKAYLKNYHEIFDSYLTSRLYLNNVEGRDYFSIDSMYFQGLRKEDEGKKNPLILPNIRDKRTYTLMDDDSFTFVFDKRLVLYNEASDTQIFRSAFDLSLNKNIQLDNGHLFSAGIHNRMDFYYFDLHDSYISSNISKFQNDDILNKKINASFRHIPELSGRWSYPLFANISDKTTLNIEPVTSFNIGKGFKNKYHKFGLIDSPKYDLDEVNIFARNRFSGIDYHEYGRRLSYGANASLSSDILYLHGFLGQSVNRQNVQIGTDENVGSVGCEIMNQYVAHYKFRKDKRFNNIRDETMLGYNTQRGNIGIYLIRLDDISRYFAEDSFNINKNKIKNLRFNAALEVIPNLKINADAVLDVTENNQWRELTRGIGVTYLKDCVSIGGRISQDFTHDKSRGVEKNTSYSFTLGMKVLNM